MQRAVLPGLILRRRLLRYHCLPYILDVGDKKTEKVALFQPLLFLFHVYFSHMNQGTSIQLERCAMYHCAPGVRRLRTNSISIDRRWIRPRFCYFTLPLPFLRPFIHDRQLDSDIEKKKLGGWKACHLRVWLGCFARPLWEGHRWLRRGKLEEEGQTMSCGLDLPWGTTDEWK